MNRIWNGIFGSAAMVALGASAASAQTADQETIIVTGSRTGLEARQIGSALSVVTREDIESGQMQFAKDALQDVPGLQISNDRPGAVTGVYIRGSDSDQVLVLIDGLELGDPSNISTSFQFDHLTTADIERIEVLRGNQSSLYGSDAIGGVINVITRRPGDAGIQVDIDAEGGSYGTRRIDASIAGDTGLVDFRLGVDSLLIDGPSRADPNAGPAIEDDAYERRGLSARLGFELASDWRLELRGLASDTETDLDGTGMDQTFYAPDVDKDETIYALSLSRSAADSRWRHELAFSRYDAERVYEVFGDRLTGEKQNLRFFSAYDAAESLSLAFGFDLEDESTDQFTGFSGSFIAANSTDSVFAEAAITPVDDFTLTFAARSDNNERFGRFSTHRLTAAWVVESGEAELKFRASWGTGAKAPGLYQLFDPLFGNPDLQVEESRGYDVGLDWAWGGGTTLSISYFDLDIDDEIDFFGSYVNLGATQARGVETFLSKRLSRRVDWSLGYTHMASHDRQTGDWLGRPRNSATTQISFDVSERVALSARARFRSRNAASFGGVTDSFVVADVLGSYELNERLEVYGRIVNVFDEDYQYEWGSSTYDRSLFAGVRVHL